VGVYACLGMRKYPVTRGGADLRFEFTNQIAEDIIIFYGEHVMGSLQHVTMMFSILIGILLSLHLVIICFVTHQFNIITLTENAKLMPEVRTATPPCTWLPHRGIEGIQLCVLFLHVEIIAFSTTQVNFKVCLLSMDRFTDFQKFLATGIIKGMEILLYF